MVLNAVCDQNVLSTCKEFEIEICDFEFCAFLWHHKVSLDHQMYCSGWAIPPIHCRCIHACFAI